MLFVEELNRQGISADYYHAGLDAEDKNAKQDKWKTEEKRVIVATNAFGMGIDKGNVRIVIHADIPNSLEEYYQEAGRCGRDGNRSYAVLVGSERDKSTLKKRITESFPSKDFVKHVYEMAGNFLNVAIGSGYDVINEFNFGLFWQTFDLPPTATHNAVRILSRGN